MSQQEQAMLRYNYLLSVTKDAQGDFARTSMSWANQTRILTERFNSFKATIGIGLINLLTPALAVVNDLLGRLQTLAEYFRVFTSALMGQNSEQQTNTSNAVEGTNKLIDAQNNLGKAINKVAKEKKGALAGFDELNILQQNNSSGSDDGASAGGSGMQMPDLNMPKIDTLANENVTLSKNDWDSFETSWDFKKHPFLTNQPSDSIEKNKIESSYAAWDMETRKNFNKLKLNEVELNRIFIDIYGLQDELTPAVEDKDVSIRKADLGRDIRSIISYAVGCMFGRYSLDVDGLVYAGGEWNADKYSTFIPDKDNVIPINDEEYFKDDVVGLFCAFLKKTFGTDTLEENLDFIAKALGN
jgi:hypothetical protein